MLEPHLFFTFSLQGLLFGIDVRNVQEVLLARPVTPAPLASRVVHGLINLRGQIIVVIDLLACLQLPIRPMDRLGIHLVVRTTEELMSFLVDVPGDVHDIGDAALEPLPNNLEGPSRDLLKGVINLSDRLLHILDTSAVVDLVIRLRDENFVKDSSARLPVR